MKYVIAILIISVSSLAQFEDTSPDLFTPNSLIGGLGDNPSNPRNVLFNNNLLYSKSRSLKDNCESEIINNGLDINKTMEVKLKNLPESKKKNYSYEIKTYICVSDEDCRKISPIFPESFDSKSIGSTIYRFPMAELNCQLFKNNNAPFSLFKFALFEVPPNDLFHLFKKIILLNSNSVKISDLNQTAMDVPLNTEGTAVIRVELK